MHVIGEFGVVLDRGLGLRQPRAGAGLAFDGEHALQICMNRHPPDDWHCDPSLLPDNGICKSEPPVLTAYPVRMYW